VPPMQKRLLDAVAAIPGVESVGSTDALLLNDTNASDVFTDGTTDLRAASAATSAYVYHISPEYLHARVGHSGRARGTGKGSRVGCPWAAVHGTLASRVLAHIVYQATPRDPIVLGGVVLAMALLGLVATWIPARRALSVDPMILLREE